MCLCVSFLICRESLPCEVADRLRDVRKMMIDWIETAFAIGQVDGSVIGVRDPKREAPAILALLDGA